MTCQWHSDGIPAPCHHDVPSITAISRVSSVKIMPEGQAHILTYLGYKGICLPVLIGILLFIRCAETDAFPKRIIAATLSFAALLAFAYWANRANPSIHLSLNPERMPLDYRTPAIFLPFLMMLFLVLWQRCGHQIHLLLFAGFRLGLSVGIGVLCSGTGLGTSRAPLEYGIQVQSAGLALPFHLRGTELFYVWRFSADGCSYRTLVCPLKRTVFIVPPSAYSSLLCPSQ